MCWLRIALAPRSISTRRSERGPCTPFRCWRALTSRTASPPRCLKRTPMQPIDISEIKNIADYDLERERWRPQILALKDRRRIAVGEHLTFLFENRETVRYQIQEMMRIERITEPEAIAHEVATYNELIPQPGELSATLLIEYASAEERDVKLRELLGLEKHIWLAVNGTARIPTRFDEGQIAPDRRGSVKYVQYRTPDEQVERWRQGVSLICDHPAYRAE